MAAITFNWYRFFCRGYPYKPQWNGIWWVVCVVMCLGWVLRGGRSRPIRSQQRRNHVVPVQEKKLAYPKGLAVRHERFAARTLCGTDALQQHGLASLQHGHCAARTLCGTNTAQHEHCAARNALQHEHCATQSGLLILDITAGLHITRGDSNSAQETFPTICVKATPNGLMVSAQGADARGPGSIPGTGTFTPFCSQPLSTHKPVAGSIPAVRIATCKITQ